MDRAAAPVVDPREKAAAGMIITIDGPAGTGKSAVSRRVAERLGYAFLDTGAMYRAVALEAIRREVPLDDARQLAFVARNVRIRFDFSAKPPALLLNGENVSHLLRGAEVTSAASAVAAVPAVRELLVAQQRQIGTEHGDLVTEGRDQGSVVFPGAPLKVYLDADPKERARRRVAQLRRRGEVVDPAAILAQMTVRDRRDSTRSVGPLAVPANAVTLDTTSMDETQVVDRIVELAREVRT